MTYREDNALLDVAQSHEAYCREVASGIQIIAGIVSCVMIVVACFFAMHLGL